MKKLSTRVLSMLLVALMVISVMPMTKIEAEAASSFTPRYTAPSKTGWYANYNRNNCVAYARCRANEILGNKTAEGIFTNGLNGLGIYYTNAKNMGFSVGKDPKPGAIMLSSGHVAIVEAVTDSTIIWTEGNYSYVAQEGGTTFAVVLNGGTSSSPTNPGGCGTWFDRREVSYNKQTGRPYSGFRSTDTWYGYIYLVDDGGVVLPPIKENEGPGLEDDTHYDSNAKYSIGEYMANASIGVNMRSGAGTNYGKIGKLVPYKGKINITETNGNWGKGVYGGYTGWVCLEYFDKISVPDATTPKITGITANDMAKGKNCVITWGGSSNAVKYEVSVNDGPAINCGTETSYQQTLTEAKTYSFKVRAINSVDKASSWSDSVSCVSHAPCLVTIKDYNGAEIEKKYVDYGGDISIQAPSREGYTFQGWSGSTHGITKDITLTPIYKINTYNVKFVGYNNEPLGETQKVNYGEDATPPADTKAPEGYEFVNWSSEEYKNVFTKAEDKTITISAIYKWANENIPITCKITDAYRDSNGYHVTYNLKNNVNKTRNGRAIITLKTAEGKLVYTTESKAFSMPGNSEKNNIDEFFECSIPASVIEIIVVNSYTSGIPISNSVSTTVREGLGWSSWVTVDNEDDIPDGAEVQTVYQYRTKETKTANTKTLSGWTWDGTRTESVGGWTNYSDSYAEAYENEQMRREVQTQQVPTYRYDPVYNYFRYSVNWSGGRSSPKYTDNHPNKYEYQFGSPLEQENNYYKWWYSQYNYCAVYERGTNGDDGAFVTYNQVQTGSKFQYRYRDIYYTYNFWRWGDWSEITTTPVAKTDTRDVKELTQYRTYYGVEDTSGTPLDPRRYYVGTDFAGKQATLFIYKFDAASDYTDEYIDQVKVDEDGYCTFEGIKLREEPSIKTGDMTFALGIEGTTNTFVVETLEAPKPTYTVNFYDWDGTIIETQTVTEGESATLPSYIPEKEGYDFIGWSDTLTNVREDRDIFADMEKKEYQVIFVDWENQLIEVKTFQHGDVLVTPEFTQVKGYTFDGWDAINEGKVLVTSNMVVNAQYKANVYTVKFCDYDGNIIDVQEVEYNESAVLPDNPKKDGVNFAGWFNPEGYQYVEEDVTVLPAYYFDETCDIPTVNYYSGEYSESIEIEFSSNDENAVIYYYINNDITTEKIYTTPISVDKTTVITFYATSLGKNNSSEVTNYYCINRDFTPSKWMIYDSLPEDVCVNAQDYIIESATGYRYKNTVKTSSVAVAADYVADGWEYLIDEYSAYSSWQDAVISVDNSLIGFEVETREAEDTTKQRYRLTRYKYTDANGAIAYSNAEVEGYACTLEETFIELNDPAANPAGFFEGNTSIFYWEIDGEMWFNRKTVSGVKTQYRSRYKNVTYYKWSDWGVTAPEYNDVREYESGVVYRYDNKIYHLVSFDNNPFDFIMVEDGKYIDSNEITTVEGHILVGLYTDEQYENSISLNTPITKSITLYAKYEPKEFTVIFQTDGGFELDVQKVKYMEAATEPSVFNMPGYVFSKWDKDFSCITEDTVVTGKYYKESDYARISLDRTVLDMFQGTSVKLGYTISPANLGDEAVEWSSSDPTVATVDDKGVVTALLPGEVTITAMVTKTRETATCKVIVNEDCGNYIVLTANSTLNHDSLGYLRRIGFNTSVDIALVNFRNDNLEFYNIEGTKLIGSSKVGTGTTIVLKNGENVLDKETVVITGDMTGDGLLNNRDVAMVNRYLVNKVTPQECQVVALDLNGDGYINNKDAAMAARYLVGKDAII